MECDEVIIYIFKLSDNLVLLGNIRVLSKWVSKWILVFRANCAGIWYNLWCKGEGRFWVGFWVWRVSWTHDPGFTIEQMFYNVKYPPYYVIGEILL